MHHIVYPTADEFAEMTPDERIAWRVNHDKLMKQLTGSSVGWSNRVVKQRVRVKASGRRVVEAPISA